jgi:hypothetical protein
MNKLFVKLDENTSQALINLSREEYRDPHAQASMLIKESLERRGLLSNTTSHDQAKQYHQAGDCGEATR